MSFASSTPRTCFPSSHACAYAVSIRAAWSKQPTRFWPTFVILSLVSGILLSIFLTPGEEEIIPGDLLVTPLLVWTVFIGIALLPLGLISSCHTAYRRIRAN